MKTVFQSALALATILLPAVLTEAGPARTGPDSELRLESDFIPTAIRLRGDPSNQEVRSVRILGKLPAEGNGSGKIWLDTRLAELNAFGDVVRRVGPELAPIRVELRYVAKVAGPATNQAITPQKSQASQGFRLYDLIFPGGVLDGRLKLVLGTANLGPHRLLAYGTAPPKEQRNAEALGQIVPLHGDPQVTSALPDAPLGREIDLSGYYSAVDGRIHRLEVRGKLGGTGKLAFDPNYITFDSFGGSLVTTTMGYQHHQITLKPMEGDDPLGHGRRRFSAIPKDPRNTNRVELVLGRTETGPHRILLYRGDEVASIVTSQLSDRRRQEIAASGLDGLSTGEQQAIANLRRTTGHGFHWQNERGQVVALNFTGDTGRFPPEGVLTRLPHLRSIHFGDGRFPATGIADLRHLARLRILLFDGTEFQAKSLASLKDLSQLESLMFYNCQGITDEGVSQLAGLTGLKSLGFYSERLRRLPDAERCVTDAGVARLKGLVRLEHLDLFGHNLSDSSVGILSAMTELQKLALSGHGLTDNGLEALARLPKLRELRLFETAVTTNGVARVKARLPQLQVEAWDRDGHD